MKNIVILLTIILLPIYLIAQEQEDERDKQEYEKSENSNYKYTDYVDNSSKPTSPPLMLSDKEKTSLNEIKEFRNNLPISVKNELKDFREKKEKLKLEKQKLYDSLSDESKQAIDSEKKLRRKLSPKAKKALYENLD